MVTKLYLVRHGQTVWNKQGRWQGWQDSPLTEEGKRQADSIAERLKDEQFDCVLASPLGRVKQTARPIEVNLDNDISFYDELKEINLGDLEGYTRDYMKQHFPDELFAFWHNPHLFNHLSAETFEDVRNRVIPFVKALYGKYRKVLIITHTTVIKHILLYYMERELKTFWDDPVILPGSLTVCEMFSPEKAEFPVCGDVSHYGGMEAEKNVKY